MKRWPSRREFTLYYILYRYAKRKEVDKLNLGEMVDIIRVVVGSKKVAENIARGLIKQGFLRREGPLTYSVVPPAELLDGLTLTYVASRLRRRGFDIEIQDGCLLISVGEPVSSEQLNKALQIVDVLKSIGFCAELRQPPGA